jgi:Tfp pilus assembly protein PilV
MSLIEVVFAIVILLTVLLAMTQFGRQFVKAEGQARWVVLASDLAVARLELIRAHDDYRTLSQYAGTETSTSATAQPTMAHAPGFSRTTAVTRDSTAAKDQTRVSVTVFGGGLAAPLVKSMILAAP